MSLRLACLAAALLGCSPHAGPKRSEPEEPEPEEPQPVSIDVGTTASPVQTCTRVGPVTPLALKPYNGALGDVNGDGQPDVVAVAYRGQHVGQDGAPGSALVVLRGGADGTFDEGTPLPMEGASVVLGDLDGDGDLDALLLLARRAPAYRVALNNGTGAFALGDRIRIPGRFGGELNDAAMADLDGDGDLDVVVPLWDSLRVLKNRGDGRFDAGQRLTVGRDPFATKLADFDGDGYLDLVTTSGAGIATDRNSYPSGGAAVWFHRGGPRRFSKSPQRVKLSGASAIAVADLDGDGIVEATVSRTWGLTVVRDPRFWPSPKTWPAAPEVHDSWLSGSQTRVQMGADGSVLIADLGDGPALIASSYMQGRLNVATGPTDADASAIETGSFVVGLFGADVSRDGTLPDLILLNAGPPGKPYGEPAPSISVVYVDCPPDGMERPRDAIDHRAR